ncbi:type I-E CRISPR-associated protein Cas7/Cse4/CasC [Streptomyces sanyensis]|uniref:type I-E CRISPR-associated protein Cas7/Cse4/CasC n=1 Tax=Streptomyces sanyensis TaxID=568869 RepID=UPI003D787DBB
MNSRIILDVHALQNVPPSNINRDDTGAPKTAVYGGVPRARVSSQAWKRATRMHFEKALDPSELGVRTKQLVAALAGRIAKAGEGHGLSSSDCAKLAEAMLISVIDGKKFKLEVPQRKADRTAPDDETELLKEASYLVFLSARQLDALAGLAVEGAGDIKAFLKNKANKARAKQVATTEHSVDIALFGRMVTDAADINVDAAAQVAHALSVHRVEIESDYFTAVDDRNSSAEPGAGMIGTVDFNSATLYRYAALDVDLLERNLGPGLDENASPTTPVRRALEAFLDGFVSSLPTGKINTFGNHTLPDVVVVKLRSSRPVSFVSAFEKPVTADLDGGHMEAACSRLVEYVPEIERAYGDENTETWVLRVGPATQKISGLGTEKARRTDLLDAVGTAVAARLERRG